MSEEAQVRSIQSCRLCLAPDNECISIFNSYAADKEPLSSKIYNCVGIKITLEDHFSSRICHACVSYLNSWQSFKNRCLASQNKQSEWLNQATNSTQQQQAQTQQDAQQQHQRGRINGSEQSHIASSILDGISTLKKRKSLTVYPLPGLEIKSEPVDIDEDEHMKQQDECEEMVDPTMFLERTEEEGDEPIMSSSHYQQQQQQAPQPPPQLNTSIDLSVLADTKEAACRACNLKFSTRANARRHERNLHPNLFELSASPNNVTITKPTPALAAALELQRAAVAAAAEAAKNSSISTQKYRQEIVNAFNKCEAGGFDYTNPEKYQQLLTDEKIIFLQQNDEFLQQYQTMTCRCCNRYYSTYKNFMAHMRKKYAALPRNLCFNCLKLNDSKALFISHLKRRNCINLYKILHALMTKNPSFAATVAATSAAATERLRARDLPISKMFECKACPKQFRLRLEFRAHVFDEHSDMQKLDLSVSCTNCTFCGLTLQDTPEHKQHQHYVECMAVLRCITCNVKFEKYQTFMDHFYEKHLVGMLEQPAIEANGQLDNSMKKSATALDDSRGSHQTSTPVASTSSAPQKSQYFSRMPQACPICGQQYNNYNNVLRHMESKHPDQLPQTYKCVRCGIGYPRLSNLREHMVTQHAADKARHTGFEYIVNADAVKLTDTNAQQNIYSGRYDYVMKDLMSITNGGATADDDDDHEGQEQRSKKMRFDTSNASNNSTSNQYSSSKECSICSAVFSNNIGLSNHMRSHTAAAQNAAAAALAAARQSTPSSLSITATQRSAAGNANNNSKTAQNVVFKRSLEQAADRRFRRMRCRICQRRFSSKKSYRFHMLSDHQIKNVQFIKCKLCDAEFAYEKGLKVHMFKVHSTELKDEMIIKQYECDICSVIYRTESELLQHKRLVHGDEDAHAHSQTNATDDNMGLETSSADVSGLNTPVSGTLDGTLGGTLLWYQCKYCASNFNTNKKLAIHINSHDEFDSNDYSCKDCGNVYSGRKSLWVHRYKKHPQVADPSECTLCKKVFFDSQMLENHIPTCNRKPISAHAAATAAADASGIYKHKTGDDEDDGSKGGHEDASATDVDMLGLQMPEVACTMCGARFTDQELFGKHIQMHEMELYTDNPLAAMFDTGPADPNQFFLDRVNENGEYQCDLCAKTFTQITAFKVHRKWHFRGDSKQNPIEADANSRDAQLSNHSNNQLSALNNQQHLQGLRAVGLMPNPRPHAKSQKRKLELKCEYCPSTFISNNNLRRHIYELHKDYITHLPAPPEINCDEYLHCRRCELKFENKLEWIEHKVSEARTMKPYGPFQWGCDLCGAYVSRKEKLINHIHNHMKEHVIVPVKQQKEQEQAQNQAQAKAPAIATNIVSKPEEQAVKIKKEIIKTENDEGEEFMEEDNSVLSGKGAYGEDAAEDYEAVEVDAEVDDDDDDDDDDDEAEEADDDDDSSDAAVVNVNENANDGQAVGSDDEQEEVEENDEDDEEEEIEEDEEDTTNQSMPEKSTHQVSNNNMDSSEVELDDTSKDVDDDEEMDAEENSMSSVEDADQAIQAKSRFSCDLCQVYFDSQPELQQHVKMHFLNGPGSVTFSNKSKQNTRNTNNGSDVTISTS